MPTPPLPLILQKEDALSLSVYDEATNTLTEQKMSSPEVDYKGDYTECTVAMNPTVPNAFAHVTTNTLHYSKVVKNPQAEGMDTLFTFETAFKVDMPHTVLKTTFSPRGNFLVTFAMMDPKRTPDGNLSIFDVQTGKLLRRAMQGNWPAVSWSADEEYLVRWTQGALQVLPGHLEEKEAPMISKTDLMLAKDKEVDYSCSPAEGMPLLALFKPIEKNRPASFSIFRLPQIQDNNDALLNLGFGRAEAATASWSPSGKHVALLVKQGSAGSKPNAANTNSYYGNLTLHLVDVMNRSMKDVKLKLGTGSSGTNTASGGGEVVHDCRWAPHSDELLVIHGNMPRNKATIVNAAGVPQMTFGEGPRNMALWSPDGSCFMVGGSGNLAGDYQFYTYSGTNSISSPNTSANRAGALSAAAKHADPAVQNAATTQCVGEFSEKCSVEKWAPDSHHMLYSTIFTRLRVDNKIVIAKKNGARQLTEKFKALYGAYWVAMENVEGGEGYMPRRPASPRPSAAENPKPQAYRPPGGHSVRAAALLRGPDASTATAVKPAGPVGAKLAAPKKKGGKRK